MVSTRVYDTLRPTDEALSKREKFQVQAHRHLFILGAVLLVLFGVLHEAAESGGFDPMWGRLVVSVLAISVVIASYLFDTVRRHFGWWVFGILAVSVGWGLTIVTLNDFAANYEIGLLFTHAIYPFVIGLGGGSVRRVVGFTMGSLLATVGVILISSVSVVEEMVLLGAMGTVSIVVVIVVQRMTWIQRELEEQESRLRGLANSVPGIVFQFYARGEERGHYFVSEHAEEVLGISAEPDEFLERVRARVPQEDRRRILRSIESAIDERTTWRAEFPFETPSGERIWLLGTSTPEVREDEIVYNGFLLDITDRKQAEHALRQSKEEAEEASQVKTAMLANMSHEVRTPLTSIIGFSEILENNLDGEMEGFAHRTHQSSKRLLETLESVLQLSKLEAGAASLDREKVSLPGVMQNTIALLEPKADEKSISIDTIWPEHSVMGLWNQNALRRIGRNLLENAIKFTPAGGDVNVRVRRDGARARLEVEDTGIGISEEHLPDIFQAFRQESEGIRSEYEGSGLGLSIVDHLVDELGGRVDVETRKGDGTRFIVELPDVLESPSQKEAPAPAPRERVRVLS